MSLPPYVEYGGRVDSPAPFLSDGGELRALALDADAEKLDALVERALTVPAQGAVEYRAIGGIVLLQAGRFARVSCQVPPFDQWGGVPEVVACFWVPVLAGREHLGVFVAERFGFFAPFVFVNNPMSYVGGRDVYGYSKSEARFEPASGRGPKLKVSTFGGNFTAESQAGWHKVLEIEQLDGGGPAGEVLEGIKDVAGALVPGLIDLIKTDGDLELPGLKLMQSVLSAALAGRGNQVFLKQFRDADDGTRACYQAVVEAGATFTKAKARPVGHAVRVTIHPLDSHPITEELGVATQTTSRVLDCELSFVVERGEVVAP
ncbi:MAG: hypothetical protein QOI80_2503 [Solirubrobacteraceae bacterium]|nr:hypothetical protein [Solirubrobacteraceae bacterium]